MGSTSTDAIYFDKGFVGFTRLQVGQLLVSLTFVGDMLFQVTRFLTDHREYEHLNPRLLRRNSIKLFIIFPILIILTLVLVYFNVISSAFAWAYDALVLGLIFWQIGRRSKHMPTTVAGLVVAVACIVLLLLPVGNVRDHMWESVFSVIIGASFIGAFTSYIIVQQLMESE